MHNDNIDMIITAVGRIKYVNILIESIDKYTEYPHKIYVVTDVRNDKEKKFFDELNEYYEDNEKVTIVESTNKDDDREGFAPCKVDGRLVGKPSFYKSEAYETGINVSNGRYICMLDYDVVFLNEWTKHILPLLKDNFFVSAMWRADYGIARDQFFIYDRETFEKCDLVPNCDVSDTTGNVTHYALNNNKSFYICENSSDFGDLGLRSKHVLNLRHGEQIFICDIPFLYHYGRGSAREEFLYNDWIEKTTQYLRDN